MALANVLNEKQIDVLKEYLTNSHWNLMINHGGVRAGKTFINNILFLFELRRTAKLAKLRHDISPKYILAGASDKTIYNNVISELENTFGLIFKRDTHKSLHVKFPGLPEVQVVQAYTGSIAGLRGIRGMTSYGAYINEASLAVQDVFNEIRSRCSQPNARVICDTNPDVPTHYLKTDYIDSKSDYVISNHFTIFDNSWLPDEYIKSKVETTPKGMFYDRDILGLWVSGEGLVFGDYNQHKNVISLADYKRKKQAVKYIAGVDWGFEHKGVITVLSVTNDNHFTLIEEYTHKHWQTSQWLNVAKGIVAKYGNIPFYCDSARPEYVTMFQRAHLRAVNANKSILYGVQIVAGLIKSGNFQVVREAIHYFEKELYQYVWNEKTGLPLKADGNDDVMDAVRYPIASYIAEQDSRKANITQSAYQKESIVRKFGLL